MKIYKHKGYQWFKYKNTGKYMLYFYESCMGLFTKNELHGYFYGYKHKPFIKTKD